MKLDSVSNTSFQAKLDITKVKTNKARWKNIAKTFDKETKGIQGVVKVSELKCDTCISANRNINQFGCEDISAVAFNSTIEQLLAKYDDNAVVKKLTKLLNIGSIAGTRKEKALDKFYRNEYYESKLPDVSLRSQYDSIIDTARNKAEKDAFWRNFDIVL